MSKEHEPLPADPEDIPPRWAQLLAQFQQLPTEDQANVLIELAQRVEAEPDRFNEIFPVTGVSRADLQERLYYSDATLAELDDPAMREIAGKLEDAYVENEFWHHVEIVASEILAQKLRLSAQK